MSQKRISTLIFEKFGKGNSRSPLFPKSQSIQNFDVLITKKAEALLKELEIEVSIFSGNPKIILQKERTVLEYPDHLFSSDSHSDQNIGLETYVMDLLSVDGLSIKLETNAFGGIFKWLFKDEQLLLITIYKIDPSRSRRKSHPETPYTIRIIAGDRSSPSNPKQMARLVYSTFIELKKTYRTQFDEAYRKYLDHAFKPFEDFLYNERLSIRDPKYRPQCKYQKREPRQNDDRIYLDVQDPPRQITEGGNSVVPASESKNKRYTSARISDFDEFEQLLIFEEGFRLKDWPNEGVLLLEGDMASNRRKWNAIHQLKTRGLTAHAKLADVLIRPWGLIDVTSLPRSYFNRGISHDNAQSQAQAQAVDMALSTPDVSLIHGPPGTGKTTVIVEIIRHVISNGGRVIMCAPTHVAVDNVLERTADIKGISAVRVGGRAYMDDELKKFRLNIKAKSFELALPSFTKASGLDSKLKDIQDSFVGRMESKGTKYLENLAISQANLVCGTTIGIARYEPTPDEPIDFDVLIIDEASKATVMEFLVPGVRARKWILVGDHRQLPPYVNEQEIRIYVQRYFEKQEVTSRDQRREGEESIVDDMEDDDIEEEITIYDEKTNQLIASLRRYHEELHALSEGQIGLHWKRLLELFEYSKRPIQSIEEMINFALGSCFHYFLKRVDRTRNARLIVQHRMPSILADFLDEAIYKGNLKTSDSAATHGLSLPAVPSLGLNEFKSPLVFLSTEKLNNRTETPGKYKGYYNTSEAEVIAELIAKFSMIDVSRFGYSHESPLTIGVITYYAGQSREINKHLRTVDEIERDRGWRYNVPGKPIKIRVSIVDRFQGQEQDIVILSLTRSNKGGAIGFLKNLQRVNVSLSRAKQNLIVVGNANFFANTRIRPTPILKKLAKYCGRKKLIKYIQEID
ncbi:MAG: AAA domain-containing protein [Candidatus Kariarchaeaceae archaeon]